MTWMKRPIGGSSSEERIQDEIRRRILAEAKKREAVRESRDATKATLDALEDIVSLPRDEMERIAEQVKAEFRGERRSEKEDNRGERQPEKVGRSDSNPVFWILAALVVFGFFGFRRGFPGMMIVGGAILVVLVVRLLHSMDK